MKISKFVQLIKDTGRCIVIHTPSGIYLSTGHSIYSAEELPDITGKYQIAAVLDIEPKKLKKIHIEEESCESRSDIIGYDFSGADAGEMEIEKMITAAVVDGCTYAAFRCRNGELLFFDEQLLSPIKDRIKDQEAYLNYAARIHPDGHKYIVVKDGFEILAVILPAKILTDKYINSLTAFYRCCEDQYTWEKQAAARAESTHTQEEAVEDDE